MCNINKLSQRGEIFGVIRIIGLVLAIIGMLLFFNEFNPALRGETIDGNNILVGLVLIVIGLVLSKR